MQLQFSVPVGLCDLLRMHGIFTQQSCIMPMPLSLASPSAPCIRPVAERITMNYIDLQVSAWMWMC